MLGFFFKIILKSFLDSQTFMLLSVMDVRHSQLSFM